MDLVMGSRESEFSAALRPPLPRSEVSSHSRLLSNMIQLIPDPLSLSMLLLILPDVSLSISLLLPPALLILHPSHRSTNSWCRRAPCTILSHLVRSTSCRSATCLVQSTCPLPQFVVRSRSRPSFLCHSFLLVSPPAADMRGTPSPNFRNLGDGVPLIGFRV